MVGEYFEAVDKEIEADEAAHAFLGTHVASDDPQDPVDDAPTSSFHLYLFIYFFFF